jgi:hypothetical protein
MTFLGADTEALTAWSADAERARARLSELLAALDSAVACAAWAGPDARAFRTHYEGRVHRPGAEAVEQLAALGRRAADDAEEQDAASSVDGASDADDISGTPGSGGDMSSPGRTEDSGKPQAVPDCVQRDVDDPAAIRRDAHDITQGGMGDCYFLASAAAVAQTNPAFIEKNVWFSDGKYHVRFYEKGFWGNTEEKVVDVDPEVAEHGARRSDGSISTMSVYETAYAQQQGGYDKIEDGGHAQDALFTITGKEPMTTDVEPSVDELRQDLKDGKVVVADTGPRDGEGGFLDTESWDDKDGPVPRDTVATHQYVVTGVTKDGHVELQNPWGPDGGYEEGDSVRKPGTLVLTEAEYRERFQNVTVAEDPDPER